MILNNSGKQYSLQLALHNRQDLFLKNSDKKINVSFCFIYKAVKLLTVDMKNVFFHISSLVLAFHMPLHT